MAGLRGRIENGIQRQLRKRGLEVHRRVPHDARDDDKATIEAVRDHTMTSPYRIEALCQAVRHVVQAGIPGAIVECGVWRGGSMMAVARTLMQEGAADRDLYLFDTFEGMTAPTEHDVSHAGHHAGEGLKVASSDSRLWARAKLDVVRQAMASTGYPQDLVRYVVGPVEQTLPAKAPKELALMRLDTDWYASTKHEWTHLYPRLRRGGIVIVDDYGFWKGARKATDEYLAETGTKLLLHRIDDTGRIAVKLGV